MKELKKIYISCDINHTLSKHKIEEYVSNLEQDGHIVYLPYRDTTKNISSIEICDEIIDAIKNSDEVHIFYSSISQCIHFDLGIVYTLKKDLIVIENEITNYNNQFSNMIVEWSDKKHNNNYVE